ncbi:MAG: HAD family hydrolase [Gammaproteobacteria bacterium]
MKTFPTPDLILFDLDNTFYHYETSHQHALQAIKEKLFTSLDLRKEAFQHHYEQAKKIIKNNLKNTASSHNRLLYFQIMLESLGMKSQPSLALDCEQTYWQTFLSKTTLVDGVHECMKTIKKNNIPCGLVTNLTTQIQFKKLIHFKLDDYFDYIVTSEEVGIEKPHHKMFERLLKKFDTPIEKIWMVGDSLEDDIQGAKNALSCITIHMQHDDAPASAKMIKADAVIKDFNELNQLVAHSLSYQKIIR